MEFDNFNYYWKSRQSKDACGNNTLHHCYEIPDIKLRRKFLLLLLRENVGDLSKRNKMGYTPFEFEQHQPISNLSEELKPYYRTSLQEEQEGDYLIVTT